MNKIQEILMKNNILKLKYYKKKAHKGINGTEKDLSINEVNNLINDFVNFEMEWRIKTVTNDVEHFYFIDVNDVTHNLEVNEDNLYKAYTMLYMWYKGVLDFDGALNIGDYDIVRKFYIYAFECEELVFSDGLLSEEFENYINENKLHQAEPKDYVWDFFEYYKIEVE